VWGDEISVTLRDKKQYCGKPWGLVADRSLAGQINCHFIGYIRRSRGPQSADTPSHSGSPPQRPGHKADIGFPQSNPKVRRHHSKGCIEISKSIGLVSIEHLGLTSSSRPFPPSGIIKAIINKVENVVIPSDASVLSIVKLLAVDVVSKNR
jgi:hypothetical protein